MCGLDGWTGLFSTGTIFPPAINPPTASVRVFWFHVKAGTEQAPSTAVPAVSACRHTLARAVGGTPPHPSKRPQPTNPPKRNGNSTKAKRRATNKTTAPRGTQQPADPFDQIINTPVARHVGMTRMHTYTHTHAPPEEAGSNNEAVRHGKTPRANPGARTSPGRHAGSKRTRRVKCARLVSFVCPSPFPKVAELGGLGARLITSLATGPQGQATRCWASGAEKHRWIYSQTPPSEPTPCLGGPRKARKIIVHPMPL